MNETKKIQDQLDGSYWQVTNNRDKYRYYNSSQNQHVRHHPYRRSNEKPRKNENSYDQTLQRIERQQDRMLKEVSDIKILLQQQQQNKVQTTSEKPVSSSTFERFLNHFEQNISELRQSVDNIAKNDDIIVNLNDDEIVPVDEKTNCAAQLLMLKEEAEEEEEPSPPLKIEVAKEMSAPVQVTATQPVQVTACPPVQVTACPPVQATTPLTIWSVLKNSEPKTGTAKWSAKNFTNNVIPIEDSVSNDIENAYKQYFSNGQYNPAASVTKHFQTDLLFIDFESRRGTFRREPVCFSRTL